MKHPLELGIEYELRFRIPESKTVPALYPEAPEFQEMPEVLATGFFVGMLEWACIKAVNPYLNWPEEQTVGTHIDVSHCAATPPGLEVTAKVKLTHIDGQRLAFEVEAHDGVDIIGNGTHERFIIDRGRFAEKVRQKAPLEVRNLPSDFLSQGTAAAASWPMAKAESQGGLSSAQPSSPAGRQELI